METLVPLVAALIAVIALDRGDAAARRSPTGPSRRLGAVGVTARPGPSHELLTVAASPTPAWRTPETVSPTATRSLSTPASSPTTRSPSPRTGSQDPVLPLLTRPGDGPRPLVSRPATGPDLTLALEAAPIC